MGLSALRTLLILHPPGLKGKHYCATCVTASSAQVRKKF